MALVQFLFGFDLYHWSLQLTSPDLEPTLLPNAYDYKVYIRVYSKITDHGVWGEGTSEG